MKDSSTIILYNTELSWQVHILISLIHSTRRSRRALQNLKVMSYYQVESYIVTNSWASKTPQWSDTEYLQCMSSIFGSQSTCSFHLGLHTYFISLLLFLIMRGGVMITMQEYYFYLLVLVFRILIYVTWFNLIYDIKWSLTIYMAMNYFIKIMKAILYVVLFIWIPNLKILMGID